MAPSKKSAKKKQAAAVPPRRVLAYAAAGAVVGLSVVGVAAVLAWSPGPPPPAPPVVTAAAILPATAPVETPPPAPAPAPVLASVAVESSPRPALESVVPALPAPIPAGIPPWQGNALPSPTGAGPKVAIVIDDAGLDHVRTARAIALPGPLTISFLTYGEGLQRQVQAAHAAGHELMLHVAMEPSRRTVDPGPDVLLRDIEPDEVLARLRRVLARFDGYVGVNNHMGSLFTSDLTSMHLVLSELKRRGLMFLDSKTSPESVGARVARGLALPFAERDVFLDNDPLEHKVDIQLAELEKVARTKGFAVAIGHPRDGTLEALAKWIPDARARGFVLVPVTTIVHDAGARDDFSVRR